MTGALLGSKSITASDTQKLAEKYLHPDKVQKAQNRQHQDCDDDIALADQLQRDGGSPIAPAPSQLPLE